VKVEIVDTNVILAANGQHSELSEICVAACALRLKDIKENKKLALDDSFEILKEYQNKTTPKQGMRPGDAFVKWALNNQRNKRHVVQIKLTAHVERGFNSFPDDVNLIDFDPSDRKFVAVSNGHPQKPPILQAADSKWIDWELPLSAHGIQVEFVCLNDIRRFHHQKHGV
jgi:hypothetical protein